MKAPKVFTVVLVAHLLAFSLLFVQQGCQTTPPEERVDRTRPLGPGEDSVARADYQRAPARDERPSERPQRAAPSRPDGMGFDDRVEPLEDDPSDFPDPADETILTPLPRIVDDEPVDDPAPEVIRPDEPVDTRTYTVQSGDNVWNIARRENVAMDELLELNNLTRESIIQPGQELRIPAGTGAQAMPEDRPRPRETVDIPEGAETYTVQRGDSLSVIAQRHGTTVAELKSLNNLQGDTIRIDQELILPDGSAPAASAAPRTEEAPPPDMAEGTRHTVASGETIGAIAARFDVSVEEVMRANNISDPRRLRAGQEIVIPGTREEVEEEPQEETVEPVDEALPVVPDEPEEMEFIEDDDDDDDVPLVPIIPDDDEEEDS